MNSFLRKEINRGIICIIIYIIYNIYYIYHYGIKNKYLKNIFVNFYYFVKFVIKKNTYNLHFIFNTEDCYEKKNIYILPVSLLKRKVLQTKFSVSVNLINYLSAFCKSPEKKNIRLF